MSAGNGLPDGIRSLHITGDMVQAFRDSSPEEQREVLRRARWQVLKRAVDGCHAGTKKAVKAYVYRRMDHIDAIEKALFGGAS